MLAVNYTNLRDNMKRYMDQVTDDYETMIVTRKNNKNVVILSEETYNNLMENVYVMGNKANYDWLMESKEQLEKGREELDYIDSVLDTVDRAENEKDLAQIREELTEQGYLKVQKGKKPRQTTLPPLEFESSDGFKILVGRNNRQNDKLTLKTASKNDMWLHTKDIHGSHVIVVSDGKEISDTAIYEAARLAAYHSKARNSSQVPVDCTLVRYVSKPNGSKPGMVIYVNNKTLYVKPSQTVEKQ